MACVVCVGGGHGLALSLRAARTYAAAVTAVVATSDDGGSSGRLRAQLDVAAVGDLRRCLTALAPDRVLADRFEHRFAAGDLAGHPVGNLVLAGFLDAGDDLVTAVGRAALLLGIEEHAVLPATSGAVTLVATTPHGEVRGQVAVQTATIDALHLDPPHPHVPDAVQAAIKAADQVVMGPGSFHTSVLAAVLAVRGCLAETAAQLVYVANLNSHEAEAPGRDVAAHVAALEAHGVVPHVVVTQLGGLPEGRVPGGIRVVVADIDRPHGLAHDADLLGAVLGGLAPR
jgi:uncharacterized cofD-like protein